MSVVNESWYEQVSRNILMSEYEIRYQESSKEYQSPNRAHNLRFSYYLDGFKVCPREDKDKWKVEMRLKRYGREGNLISYEGKDIVIDKNRCKV